MFASTDATANAETTIILDVCSGTGTIGICAAKEAEAAAAAVTTMTEAETGTETTRRIAVIGVEMCQSAVVNSAENALANGLTPIAPVGISGDGGIASASTNKAITADFVCSRAEVALPQLLSHYTHQNASASESGSDNQVPILASWLKSRLASASVIDESSSSSSSGSGTGGVRVCAVVDPAREGLHMDCLRAIRNCPSITRLVYVSCNPTKSLIKDGVSLCQPQSKKLRGKEFRPVLAKPVDLFPYTPHCELIVVFER
jgi:hypothetical protein